MNYEQRLDTIIGIGDGLSAKVGIEAQAHFGRYLAIVASGYVETSIQLTLYEYAKLRSNPSIAGFVEDRLSRELSLNVSKIENILKRFDANWVAEINERTSSQCKEAVNSLKDLRDTFSHGGQNGTSYGIIRGYQSDARKYIAAVIDIILK